jgi:hypothetical protein
MYFVSEVLIGSNKYYSEMEKICYAVIMSARKIRHYFEAHTIKVLTIQPLNDIFSNRDSSDRINQEETRVWRDPKVKLRELDVGDLVLLQSAHTESSGKLESKWSIRGRGKTKTGGISPLEFLGQNVGAFLEHGKPPSFFCLNQDVTSEGLMHYK